MIFDFFNQSQFFNSSEGLCSFLKMRISQKFKPAHIINLLYKNLLKKNSVIGVEIGLFGRYQKKLRNRKI